jgi:hypothetical protein
MTVAGAVDMISGHTLEPDEAVTADRWVVYTGWTVDLATRCGAAGVVVLDEAGRSWSGPANVDRPDVAAAFGVADPRVGFEIAIPAAALGPGRHALHVAGLDAAGRSYANTFPMMLDVVPATRPFPLTARVIDGSGAFRARIREIGDDANAAPAIPLPAVHAIEVARGIELEIDGWACLQSGEPAAELFVELAHASAAIPAQRLASRAGRRRSDAPLGFERAPADDAWFVCPFDTSRMQPSDYTLALICVRPDRTTVERSPLGTLRILVGDDV